jgi:hypothetical protein
MPDDALTSSDDEFGDLFATVIKVPKVDKMFAL